MLVLGKIINEVRNNLKPNFYLQDLDHFVQKQTKNKIFKKYF